MDRTSNTRFVIFWGCTIPLRLPWIEVAARKVLPKLGIEMKDLPFSCCPDPIASKALDHMTWLSLAARNLALAEEKKCDILTLCSGCFETLKIAQSELQDKAIRKSINDVLKPIGREYQGSIRVFHIVQWLYEEFGLENLRQVVTHPLTFRVATHTGCHYMRPADILHTDDPVYPEHLDELCQVLGLEPVDYPDKNLCCGVGVGLVDRDITQELILRKIEGVHRAKAEVLVAHCPTCIQTYDSGQMMIHKSHKASITPVPVFHYLELLGLAMGLNADAFAFEEHRIPIPEPAVRI